MTEQNVPQQVLNRQTGITIGLAIAVVGAAVTAAWWFGKWTGADEAWKKDIAKRLIAIEQAIEGAGQNRWTSLDMVRWTQRLKESNPDLNVPEPYVDKQ
jgi:hypothetical protein